MMRALTVKQPWAALIVAGIKDVENRSWFPREDQLGQRILIHAGVKRDKDGKDCGAVDYDDVKGALLGSVVLFDVVPDSLSDWAVEGQWHWQLVDPQPLDEPIPCKGRLWLWQPPDELVKSAGFQP
jgi:hypothetical protein